MIKLVFPCGHVQDLNYDYERCGIKGRKHNGKRPIKAIIFGSVSTKTITSLKHVLHPLHMDIVYK